MLTAHSSTSYNLTEAPRLSGPRHLAAASEITMFHFQQSDGEAGETTEDTYYQPRWQSAIEINVAADGLVVLFDGPADPRAA